MHDDDYDGEDGPTFPLSVAIAGWIWAVLGLLMVIAAITIIVFGGGAIVLAGALGAVALRIGFAGIQMARGARDDFLWAIAASLLLGLFLVGVQVGEFWTFTVQGHLIWGTPAALLFSAATLASYGRGAYLRWRREARGTPSTNDADLA
jgi:hypothetical protein